MYALCSMALMALPDRGTDQENLHTIIIYISLPAQFAMACQAMQISPVGLI